MVSSGTSSGALFLPKFEKDCILTEGVEVRGLLGTKDEKIVRVRPCASEKGKIIAEIKLQSGPNRFFLDPELLCVLLNAYRRRFAEEKCSSKLGVARFMWKARRFYLFKHGKVNVRFALSQEDAFRTLDSVMRLVLGSILCRRCGQPAVDCASGACGRCIAVGKPEVVSTEDYFNGPLLERSYDQLASALAEAEALKDALKDKVVPLGPVAGKFHRKVRGALEFALDFSLKTAERADARLGVELASLVLSLERGYEATENIVQNLSKINKGATQQIRRLVEFAWEVNTTALNAFKKGDLQLAAEVRTKYRRFQGEVSRLQSGAEIAEGDLAFLLENIGNVAEVGTHVVRLASWWNLDDDPR